MSKEEVTPQSTPSNEPMPEHYDVATSLVGAMQQEVGLTVGVLLTLAEVALQNNPDSLKAYKDMVRKETYRLRDRLQHWIYVKLEVEDPKFSPHFEGYVESVDDRA